MQRHSGDNLKFCLTLLLIGPSCYCQDNVRVPIGGRWKLDCPKVGYRNEKDRVSVIWLHNNAIWMKIENSNATIAPQLNALQRSRIGSATILNIVSNNERYKFYYDEMVTDYSLIITNAEPDDSGLWLCDVTLERTNGVTEDFRSDAYLTVDNNAPDTPIIDNPNDPDTLDDFYGEDKPSKGRPGDKKYRQKFATSSNLTGNATGYGTSYFHQTSSLFPIFLSSLIAVIIALI